MNRNLSIGVAAAILAAVPCAARPTHSSGGVRGLLQSYYHTMDAGYDEHDLTKAFGYYSDDFMAEDEDGDQEALGDVKASVSDLFDRARLIRSSSRITGMAYQEHGYSVTVQEHVLFTGVSVKTGQLAKIDAFNEVRDFWTKTPAGWRLLKTRVVRSRGLWDGHKITSDDLPDPNALPGEGGGAAQGGPAMGGDGGG